MPPDTYLDLLAAATRLQLDQLPSDPVDRLAAVTAAQLLETRAVREKASPKKTLNTQDAERLGALLPAAFARVKGQPWKVGQLTLGLTRFDVTYRDLFLVVESIGGGLGQFLARCEGREAEGFRLEGAGEDGHQRVWRIRPVGSKSP